MAVDLHLVSFFHAGNDLRRRDPLIRIHGSEIRIHAERGGVFEEMSGDRFVVHCVRHVVAGLADSQQRKAVGDVMVDFLRSSAIIQTTTWEFVTSWLLNESL